MTKRQFEDYHGYSIVYNSTGARLLSGDGSLAHPETFDGLESAKAWIDGHLENLEEERRAPHVGTVEGYTEALSLQEPSQKLWLMLKTHASADAHTMHPEELAKVAGWKRASTANAQYSKLGRTLAEQLNLSVANEDFVTTIGEFSTDGDSLIMHPELVDAIEKLAA